jgi:hypothetical protein
MTEIEQIFDQQAPSCRGFWRGAVPHGSRKHQGEANSHLVWTLLAALVQWGGERSGASLFRARSGRGERSGGPYGRNDIANCLVHGGGISCV